MSPGPLPHTPICLGVKNVTSTPVPGHGGASAVWMDTVDHRNTMSCGSSHAAQTWRATQSAHISAGNWHSAIEMDIKDVRRIANSAGSPGKYDQGLREMLDHHVDAGRIDATQRDNIKAKCGL